jgi:hypothetical protein
MEIIKTVFHYWCKMIYSVEYGLIVFIEIMDRYFIKYLIPKNRISHNTKLEDFKNYIKQKQQQVTKNATR